MTLNDHSFSQAWSLYDYVGDNMVMYLGVKYGIYTSF